MNTEIAQAWIRAIAEAIAAHRDQLTQLDAAIGDADHGNNMDRGFSAVTKALDAGEFPTVGSVLVKTGTTLVSTVGGASGPLYGSAFRAIGKQLDTQSATPEELLEALTAGLAAIQKLGAAQPGDKTIVDAYVPALEAFEAALHDGADVQAAALAAAEGAEEGMHATVPMIARKGRASYLGPRSEGHQDPGATSTALIFRALADALGRSG